jgi:hypothetical protein
VSLKTENLSVKARFFRGCEEFERFELEGWQVSLEVVEMMSHWNCCYGRGVVHVDYNWPTRPLPA